MELTAIVKVNGISEREFQGKVIRTANLYVDGRDPDLLKVGISEQASQLIKTVQDCMDKRCKAVVNMRQYKGATYLDLVSLDVLPGQAGK